MEQHIKAYFRYVYDVLVVYSTKVTNILLNATLSQYNQLHPKLKFTIEPEDNGINFLALPFCRFQKHITASTGTEALIHYESCHTNEHKLAF
jgi:hypothetical protein